MPGRRWLLGFVVAAAVLSAILVVRSSDLKPVRGTVTSSGSFLDTWSAAPDGCAVDPQDTDVRRPGQTASIVSVLWDDPTLHDPIRGQHWQTVPDAPLRLDVSRGTGDDLRILLTTVKTTDPEMIDGRSCAVLKLSTHPESPLVKDARPALGGTLELDCTTPVRRLTARLRFTRCGS